MSFLPMTRDFFLEKQGIAHHHVLRAELSPNTFHIFSAADAVHQKWIGDMVNQPKTNPANHNKEGGPSRSASCIPKRQKEQRGQNHYLDITAMIRSLQRTEGFKDCFRRGIADCDQQRCSWRQYCLESADDLPSGNKM